MLGHVNNNKNSYKYKSSDGEDTLFTYNPVTGGVHGFMRYNRRSYLLENCGEEGHVIIEFKLNETFVEDEDMDAWRVSNSNEPSNQDLEENDTTTVVTFSVQIYFTSKFYQSTKDVPGFIDNMITATNSAYESSQVPMRIKVHCIQEVGIPDGLTAAWALKYLQRLKPTTNEIRNSADVAVLLVDSLKDRYCGKANLYSIDSDDAEYGYALSVVKKACVNKHTFSHEIGHNIGLFHDRRHRNLKYPFAQGSYIDKGNTNIGYRTIMAWAMTGHYRRVSHFSNPDVIFPKTGTATGQALADNAQLLTKQRFKLASMGDESMACGKGIVEIEVRISCILKHLYLILIDNILQLILV